MRWWAYVWPAIALWSPGEAMAILADWSGLAAPTGPDVAGALSRLAQAAGSSGVLGVSERSATLSSRPGPLSVSTPGEGGMTLLVTILVALATLIGLVALARLTIGEELFSSPSRWLH